MRKTTIFFVLIFYSSMVFARGSYVNLPWRGTTGYGRYSGGSGSRRRGSSRYNREAKEKLLLLKKLETIEKWEDYIDDYKRWCDDLGGKFDTSAARDAIADQKLRDGLCKIPVVYMCPEGLNSTKKAALASLGVAALGGATAIIANSAAKKQKEKDFGLDEKSERILNAYYKYESNGCLD